MSKGGPLRLRLSISVPLSGELPFWVSILVHAECRADTSNHSSARLGIGLRKREHSSSRLTCSITEDCCNVFFIFKVLIVVTCTCIMSCRQSKPVVLTDPRRIISIVPSIVLRQVAPSFAERSEKKRLCDARVIRPVSLL